MPRKLRPVSDYTQQRFMQISESHCGPAAVQMMLSNLGIEVTQEQVAEAGGVTSLIAMNGMRIDQLALAVRRLAPHVVFYFKDHATIAELVRVVIDYRHPVGVEWQGVFEDEDAIRLDRANKSWTRQDLPGSRPLAETDPDDLEEESETGDSDYGHYSLVVHASRRRRELIIADPYKDYFSQARIFGFETFEERWFDFNEVMDPVTGQIATVEDYRMMFVITRRNVLFPRRMGLRTFENIYS